jgi:hypothetical protein
MHDQQPTAAIAPACYDELGVLAAPPATLPTRECPNVAHKHTTLSRRTCATTTSEVATACHCDTAVMPRHHSDEKGGPLCPPRLAPRRSTRRPIGAYTPPAPQQPRSRAVTTTSRGRQMCPPTSLCAGECPDVTQKRATSNQRTSATTSTTPPPQRDSDSGWPPATTHGGHRGPGAVPTHTVTKPRRRTVHLCNDKRHDSNGTTPCPQHDGGPPPTMMHEGCQSPGVIQGHVGIARQCFGASW